MVVVAVVVAAITAIAAIAAVFIVIAVFLIIIVGFLAVVVVMIASSFKVNAQSVQAGQSKLTRAQTHEALHAMPRTKS